MHYGVGGENVIYWIKLCNCLITLIVWDYVLKWITLENVVLCVILSAVNVIN